ncbi:MAG: hypothetical protein NT070_10920 [Cyanobacteria bacterium]|nr:hypothetical protein [Cyanobacteriota bacterium]
MNLILHEAPRLLANILILQPIDERYIWMPTTAILGEPKSSIPFGLCLEVEKVRLGLKISSHFHGYRHYATCSFSDPIVPFHFDSRASRRL